MRVVRLEEGETHMARDQRGEWWWWRARQSKVGAITCDLSRLSTNGDASDLMIAAPTRKKDK